MSNQLKSCDKQEIIKYLLAHLYDDPKQVLRNIIKHCHPDRNKNTDIELFRIIIEYFNKLIKTKDFQNVKIFRNDKITTQYCNGKIVELYYNKIVSQKHFEDFSILVYKTNKIYILQNCIILIRNSAEKYRVASKGSNIYAYIPSLR